MFFWMEKLQVQQRYWLGLCGFVAMASACSPSTQSPPPEVVLEQSQAVVQNIARNVDAIAKETKRLDEMLKARETLRSTGAKLESGSGGPQVTNVDLRGIEITDTLAEQVVLMGELEKLTIKESAMSTAGWQQLGKIASLQQLDLRDCPIDNEQFQAIVSGMPNLKAIRLSGTSGRTTVDDAGLAALAQTPALRVLAVDGLWITDVGLTHVLACQQLTELYAAGTTLNDEAGPLLAQLVNLKKLRLAKTGFGTLGLESLLALQLEDLDISEASGIDDASMEVVGRLLSLKRLNLWRDTVGDAGVAHLAGLTNLQWLNLDNTHLSDAGLVHLAAMQQLTFLHLGSTGVTDAGMPALVGLKSLKDLKVTRTAVTEAGVAVVQQALSGVNVQLKYIEGE